MVVLILTNSIAFGSVHFDLVPGRWALIETALFWTGRFTIDQSIELVNHRLIILPSATERSSRRASNGQIRATGRYFKGRRFTSIGHRRLSPVALVAVRRTLSLENDPWIPDRVSHGRIILDEDRFRKVEFVVVTLRVEINLRHEYQQEADGSDRKHANYERWKDEKGIGKIVHQCPY